MFHSDPPYTSFAGPILLATNILEDDITVVTALPALASVGVLQVIRARSTYGDGGRDIVLEHNVVTQSDLGLEIGAEHAGLVTSNITVRNNVLYANEKAGLVFGGFAASVGRVRNSTFAGNTVYGNDTLGAGFGELWIQYAANNVVRGNIFYATAQNRLLTSDAGNVANTLDYNLWFAAAGPGAAQFLWNGTLHTGYPAYRAATGADAHSGIADPLLANPAAGDFHLGSGSPAIDAGDPAFVPAAGETDLDGAPRVNGPRVDAGADEASQCGDAVLQPPEQCDDGNLADGDGCDSNCTPTACGNGVVTAGEACDDRNLAAGDCCSPTCQLEPAGSLCDDGNPCTAPDTCSAGACAGVVAPATGCRTAGLGSLALRDLTPDTQDHLVWKWTQGAPTALAAFGDPASGTTAYTLCLYDTVGSTPGNRVRAAIPAGGLCRGRPCWRPRGTTGLRYANRDAAPNGVVKLVLEAGTGGAAGITLTAKGGNLAVPTLPLAQQPAVTIQLRRSDAATCWESTFVAPAALAVPTQFKDTLP